MDTSMRETAASTTTTQSDAISVQCQTWGRWGAREEGPARDAALVTNQAEYMTVVYNSHDAAKHLRISTHPDIRRRLTEHTPVLEDGIKVGKDRGRLHDKHLQRVVYHLDITFFFFCPIAAITL